MFTLKEKGTILYNAVSFKFQVLSLTVASFLAIYISYAKNSEIPEVVNEYPRLIVDTTALVIEIVMNVAFIVALHMVCIAYILFTRF
jgi:hypothetical protein